MSAKPTGDEKSSLQPISDSDTNGQHPLRSKQSPTVSIVMFGINLGLLFLLVVVIGPSGAFQLLFGFEASAQDKAAAGGMFYAIGVLIVFFIRLAFIPSFAIIAIVGAAFSLNALLKQKCKNWLTDPLSICLLAFHVACLIPPIIFVIRTFVFLIKHS